MGEEQPNSAAKVRLWMIVSCHRSYTMATLNTATSHRIVILHQQGLSQTKILKQTGVSRCAVQALLKNHKEMGEVEDRRCSGRPRKLSVANEKHISLFPSDVRCPAVPPAQNWQKPVGHIYTQLLSREVQPEVVLMKVVGLQSGLRSTNYTKQVLMIFTV